MDMPVERRRIVGRWLAVWAVMLLLTVVIGGVTRLTESGLSITVWAPVSGVLPPLSAEAWEEAFRSYQQIPEYQELNQGMTLSEFKAIYFWEYIHRMWARLVGLAFAVPFIIFAARRWLTRQLTKRLVILLVLTGLQATLGWLMVQSGLVDRTDVSPYRLAAHLGLALVIYVLTVWTAADLLVQPRDDGSVGKAASLRRAAGALVVLVYVTAIAGAFVAGLEAGKAYNTFPLMGGRFVPGGYFSLDPWWLNVFENVAAVQFNHRWIGVLTLLAIVFVWVRGQKAVLSEQAERWLLWLPAVALVQVGLGIGTLVMVVPVWLGALHQAGAVILLTVALLFYHRLLREGA